MSAYLDDIDMKLESFSSQPLALFFPKGYRHKINVPEEIAVVIHATDSLKLLDRSVYFLWKDDSEMFSSYDLLDTYYQSETTKGFQDLSYDQRKNWLIAVRRTPGGFVFEKDIKQFSDYWRGMKVTGDCIDEMIKNAVREIYKSPTDLVIKIKSDIKTAIDGHYFDKGTYVRKYLFDADYDSFFEEVKTLLPGLFVARYANQITIAVR